MKGALSGFLLRPDEANLQVQCECQGAGGLGKSPEMPPYSLPGMRMCSSPLANGEGERRKSVALVLKGTEGQPI